MTQLHLEFHDATSYLNNPWSYGAGVSHASVLLRKDVQRHLLLGRDELGFRQVRFHNVFDDAMKILQPDGSYDFTVIEQTFDWLMESGFVPYIGLSGVPSAWAKTGSAAPADLSRWIDLVRALAAHIDGRYGCDAQEWHWEIWQNPDTAQWTESRDEFFQLYDQAAKALKTVNPLLKVGGPAAADMGWLEAFVDHVSRPSEAFGMEGSRCDFVSIAGPADAPMDAAAARQLVERIKSIRGKVTTALGETVPLILCEWNPAGRTLGTANDRCNASTAVVAVMAGLADLVVGAVYQQMSDIEEISPRYEPFHGGGGLVTVNDIRKASFNAFKLLNEHIGFRLTNTVVDPMDGLTIFVSKDYHNMVRILASYDRPVAAEGTPANDSVLSL